MERFDHGGNVYRLSEQYGIPEKKIVDFSASINPLGVPDSVNRGLCEYISMLSKYPDPEQKRLRRALAEFYDISLESIICGNGSTELIYLLVKALKPDRVLIPAPTFSEYERAVYVNRAPYKSISIRYLHLQRKNNFTIRPDEFIKHMEGCTMAFLCNPNNPTGRLLPRDDVRDIAEAARAMKCYLIVDEAFIDFCPHESVIRDVRENPYLFVLRSMTKFYALPGLRLGYGIFPISLVETIKTFKEPWTVNILAQEAGLIAINDRKYRKNTLELIKREKTFIEKELSQLGIEFTPSEVNYYLLRLNRPDMAIALAKRGILVRDCSNFTGLDRTYVRIAVRRREENKILLKAFSELIYEI